jgi:hypothetical protein
VCVFYQRGKEENRKDGSGDTGGGKMVMVEEIKRRYRDEWVLVEVIEEDELGQPTEVELIVHSKARDEIYEALKETKAKYTYQFYTGEIPKKGYAVAFYEPEKSYVDGLLGLSFLKRFKLSLDFRGGILELE